MADHHLPIKQVLHGDSLCSTELTIYDYHYQPLPSSVQKVLKWMAMWVVNVKIELDTLQSYCQSEQTLLSKVDQDSFMYLYSTTAEIP